MNPLTKTRHVDSIIARAARARFEADLALPALVMLAIVVRLGKLSNSLWLDEGYSIAAARWWDGFDSARPLYFWFLAAWSKLGQGEIWLRVPSLLFGVASVVLCYRVSARLTTRSAALISALLMGLATPQLFHSQEVRLYTLTPLLLLIAIDLLLSWLERGSWWLLLGHAVAAYLALLAFPAVVLGIGMAWLLSLWHLRRSTSRLGTLLGVAAVVSVCWLPFLIRLVTGPDGAGWNVRPTLAQVVWLEGWAFTSDSLSHLHMHWHDTRNANLLLSLLVAVLAVLGAVRARGRAIGVWYFTILALVFTVSVTVQPVWTPRYFMPFFPALFCLVANGLDAIRIRWRPGFYVLFSVLAGFELVGSAADARDGSLEDWRTAAHEVAARAAKTDLIVVSAMPIDPGKSGVWDYYYRGSTPVLYWRSDYNSLDEWQNKLSELRRGLPPTAKLWLALRTMPLGFEKLPALRARLSESFDVDYQSFNGVDLFSLKPR